MFLLRSVNWTYLPPPNQAVYHRTQDAILWCQEQGAMLRAYQDGEWYVETWVDSVQLHAYGVGLVDAVEALQKRMGE